MRVWVTRAEPGASRTAERLIGFGHHPLVAPLLRVEPIAAEIDLTGVGTLAFTSPNGVAAFAHRSTTRQLPVFTVGDATAEAALAAGFEQVRSAAGDLHALAALLRQAAPGPVLGPGPEEPSGDLAALAAPVPVRPLPLYRTVWTGAAAPDAWDAVLIHSAKAARALAAALPPEGARGRLAVAISAQAAEPLGALPLAELRIADSPDEAALLQALGKASGPV